MIKIIKIKEEFIIPGTNIVLEAGDKIQIQEAQRKTKFEHLNWSEEDRFGQRHLFVDLGGYE